ncbi:hypothetical protein BpHYR1_033206 [Brachionus plicatilis]|uniref:Uncharacterized protein n=1 Tax=Brachionus plicatilis TaxID=10195 RepID=A0A3M7S781_BRAPC|nr:hypothetical protein BpHYR1_033206 [Brachionus plicatilis]
MEALENQNLNLKFNLASGYETVYSAGRSKISFSNEYSFNKTQKHSKMTSNDKEINLKFLFTCYAFLNIFKCMPRLKLRFITLRLRTYQFSLLGWQDLSKNHLGIKLPTWAKTSYSTLSDCLCLPSKKDQIFSGKI